MRYLFGVLCVCALGLMPLVGCSETSGTGGSGGEGGGGTGGVGVTCEGNVCSCNEAGIRAAIAEGGGPFTFDCVGPTSVVTQAEIIIDNDVILDGEGNLTVDGGAGFVDPRHRVFSVSEGVTAELRGLTVTGGYAGDTTGAWEPRSTCGGGVANRGVLTINGAVISNNFSEWTVMSTGAGGGGICNEGKMTIIDTTISENYVDHGGGGGILNECFATLVLANSIVSGNMAAVDGSGPIGGGIENFGTLTVINSTVSENSANCFFDCFGGGIASSGWISLLSSTVSENIADEASAIVIHSSPFSCHDRDAYLETVHTLIDGDCGKYDQEGSNSTWTSLGYNIESPGDTCGFDHGTDLVSITEGQTALGALAANGGPTMTHALGAGSVAIDRIPAVDCGVTTDQRGEPRPVGDGCDVGSFERQPEDP